MDVGTTLRTARERRELTLAQLATRTRIPVGILQSIETNAFDRVPRGIFARGFLRSYAAEVGLDPSQIVSQYLLETDHSAAAAPDTAPADIVAIDDRARSAPVDPALAATGPGWGYLLMVAALLAAVIGINRYNHPDGATVAEPAPIAELDVASDVTAAVPDAVNATATASRTVPADDGSASPDTTTLRFELRADSECWVEAIVDGRRLIYRLMQPGDTRTIEAEDDIVLRVGDPGALTYSVNGEPGRPLGRPGVAVTVRFTNQEA
jgi:cytoskeletal protein RodZ